jgi:hypothetical protein
MSQTAKCPSSLGRIRYSAAGTGCAWIRTCISVQGVECADASLVIHANKRCPDLTAIDAFWLSWRAAN